MLRLPTGLILMIVMLLGTVVSFGGSGSIQIKLDGSDIVSDSPPVIVDGRTLVPARALFEAMGGAVDWDGASREVTVTVGDVTVKLKIDSRKAYINGVETTLDVPAGIIGSRTMIPVRFVSEAAGCEVSWDGKNRIVNIITPVNEEDFTLINTIELSPQGDRIIVDADKEITDFTSFKMTNPSRFVFNIKNAKLNMKEGTIIADDNPFFKSVRYSQYTKDTVRIVADLAAFSSGTVSRSDSMRTAYRPLK